MPQFLRLFPPDEARSLLLSYLPDTSEFDKAKLGKTSQEIETALSINRITAEDIVAPHALPEFPRSTVDGYAVLAGDTYGATESMPAYLNLIGEVPMGKAPLFELKSGQCALIHTGGMVPIGADSIVMLEYTQEINNDSLMKLHDKAVSRPKTEPGDILNPEIEVLRPVARGENVIIVGEDIQTGAIVLRKGSKIRPPEIGGLIGLGITTLRVAVKPRVGVISSGDEIVDPEKQIRLGQVRDINSSTLSGLISNSGGEAIFYGIVSDQLEQLKAIAADALTQCDIVVITAGSSASTRDMTAEVINSLGAPGVLVHGINSRPGKPTILGVCNGKAVIGLPGNPVSALVNGYLFLTPVIEKLLGLPMDESKMSLRHPSLLARLTVNISSQAGREDWWPVKLIPTPNPRKQLSRDEKFRSFIDNWQAEPIFGKSNLIFTLISADGLLRISPEVTGLSTGELVEVLLLS